MALADKILAYYKLDGNANDALGNYNGTGYSVSYDNAYGKINQGVDISGSNAHGIVIPSNSAFNANNLKGIGIWINWDAMSGNDIIIGKYGDFATANNYKNGWFIQRLGSNNKVRGVIYNDNVDVFVTPEVSQPSTGGWHYYVFIIDVANSFIKLFVNGSQVGTSTALSGTFTTSNTSNIWFGYTSGDPFNGKLDEISFFSTVPTDAEIVELYNSGAGKQYPFSTAAAFIPQIIII